MKNLNGTMIRSRTTIEALNRRDWEAVAYHWHDTDDHGLSFISGDEWAALRTEAQKDGVDLDALREQAPNWG